MNQQPKQSFRTSRKVVLNERLGPVYRTKRANILRGPVIYIDQQIIDDLVRLTVERFQLKEGHIASKQRYHEVVIARNLCFYVLNVRYRIHPEAIAKMFFRDRTTVLHGTNRFLDDLDFLPYYKEHYEYIISQLPEPKTLSHAL